MSDLLLQLQDEEFRSGIESIIEDIAIQESKNISPRDSLLELLRACGYNTGLLVPYYYPEFTEGGQPMSVLSRPFALPFFEINVGGVTTVRAGRQIGKTTNLIARQRTNADILSEWYSLYVTTHSKYLESYKNRFASMEKKFRFPVKDANFRQNLLYKEYPRNNTINMIRLFESADDARSLTASEVLIDEAQHMDPDFVPVLDQCLKAMRMNTKFIAGTSLSTETFLEQQYQEGSKGTWHIPCPDGKHWINLGDENDILKIMKPEGPTCPYTSKILQVETGQYVHEDQTAYDNMLRSYHAPQIIVPEYIEDIIEWTQIYKDFKSYGLSKFMQEVMGIPKEEGQREISIEDLKRMCCLPDTLQGLEKKAQKRQYRFVISGADWGGSDHNQGTRIKESFTAHVILGITSDKDVDVLHMRKYAGMEYLKIANDIADNHRRFGAGIMCSDVGGGALYNTYLRESGKISPDKHLVLRYTGPQTSLFSRPKEGMGMFNEWYVNKTESVSSLFDAIKRQPSPRIRCYNWETAKPDLAHFLNVYRYLSDTDQGSKKWRWMRAGGKPDDFVHAMNYAFIGCKVALREPIIEDRAVRDQLYKLLFSNSASDTGSNPFAPISG